MLIATSTAPDNQRNGHYRAFTAKATEEGMLMHCVHSPDTARITYRFRPRREITEAIKANTHPGTGLAIGYHRYKIRVEGLADPATANWNEDPGKWVRIFTSTDVSNSAFIARVGSRPKQEKPICQPAKVVPDCAVEMMTPPP